MKTVLKITLPLLIVFTAWFIWTYPQAGVLALRYGETLEARAYGLHKAGIKIKHNTIASFQGGPADAPVIIMLHGYTADKKVWMRFGKNFVRDYRVVIPDLAGHGETSFKAKQSHSITAQAARVAALMDALKIEKAHIIGNSMGGFITAYFAIHYPQRTLSAGLFDPAGVTSPIPSDMVRLLTDGKNPFLVENRQQFADFYPMSMAKPPYLPGFVKDAIAQGYIDKREQHAQIFADIASQPLLTDELPMLKAPTLMVWGEQDRLIHVSATEVWAAGIPQLQLHILNGIGHMPMVESPVETAAIYSKFLKSLPK